MAATATRTARIEARVTPEALALVRQAAEIQGRSLSEFVVSAAEAAARAALEENGSIIRLSPEDQARFVETLLNPRPISPAMKRAQAHHKRLVGEV